MLTTRQRQILSYLNENSFVTTTHIAQELEVSDKTIRNELKQIEHILNNCIEIVTKPRYGVSIKVLDLDKFKEANGRVEKKDVIESPRQRVLFLCEYLLTHDEYVKIEDLADLLYLSTVSISQDLKSVRDKLQGYNLEIVHKPKCGVKIDGSEKNKRICLSNLYHDDEKVLNHDEMNDISLRLEKIFSSHNYVMSDLAFNNLTIHLYIAIRRIQEANFVPLAQEKLDELKTQEEYIIAKEIADEMSNKYNLEIPESECGYISIHLLGKKTVVVENDDNKVIDEDVMSLIDKMLEVIDEEYNLSLSDDLDLRLSLALHMIPMKNRLEYDMVMRNPLLEDIKNHYMLAFMAATSACSVISEYLNKEIPEDEIGYIALHINLSIEKQKSEIVKKNIVMVCSTGRGTAELLEHQYRMKFGPYINKLQTCDYQTISKIDFTDIDFVISTVPISVQVPVPVIQVKCFLQDNDVRNIKKHLRKTGNVSIEHFFDKRLFFVNVPARNKEEVIDYMTMRISLIKKVPRNFKELILLREKKAVTEFGKMIAIPHPYKTCTDETFASIAILKNPILWDKKMVQMIFMVSIAKNEKQNLQKFYGITSKMIMSKQYIKLLIQEKNYSTLMDIFRTIENDSEDE